MNEYEIDENELYKYNGIIDKVKKGSIAHSVGIKPKDRLVAINSHVLMDIIDYNYCIADSKVKLLIERNKGEFIEFEIEKDYSEDIGITFESPVFDKVKRCTNSCIFCFMDQMPKNLRKSLYLKDEDYRLSFLYGNFITMTSLNEEDFERIKSLYLSPLYISVHTTNLKLRKKILNCHKAENILKQLEELTSAGISIHTQIVLIPDVNDKEELVKTIEDLSYFYPQLESIGIVPVGITKYREGLYPIRSFTKKEIHDLIEMILPFQKKFKRRFDKNLVYLADEFYLQIDKEPPSADEYDGYPQFENGIGIVRNFWDEYHSMLKKIPSKLKYPKEFSIITGELGAKAISHIINDLNSKISGLKIKLEVIKNEFFGHTVTVTGLIAGSDIINHFSNFKKNEMPKTILIPSIMLNDDELFIDDFSIDTLKKELSVNIDVINPTFKDLLDYIIK